MKILILCKYGDEINNKKYDNLNNISSVYGYFFYKNLIDFCSDKLIPLDIDIKDYNMDFNDLDEYEYCFYLYNRGISFLSDENYNILRNKINKFIFTIAPTSTKIDREDYLIHFAGKQKDNSIRINLVSDKDELPINKSKDFITILVDHEYYGNKSSNIYNMDKTKIILKSLLEYKQTNKNIQIIQINTKDSKGYSIINSETDIHSYERNEATSFKNIYKVYSMSDIFCVTHPEALGLSCVECNQAGCKVISPDGYIKHEYGKKLDIRYIKDDNYNWDEIIDSLDSFRTHRKVRNLTYYKAVRHIFKKCKI